MMQYVYSASSTQATQLRISLGSYLRAPCCIDINHVFAAVPTNTSEWLKKYWTYVFALLRSENG